MYDDEWEGTTSGILSIMEDAIEEAAATPTEAQRDAAEALWDALRAGDWENMPDVWQTAMEAFEGQDALFDKLDSLIDELSNTGDESWRDTEDLPAYWWLDADAWLRTGNNNNGLTSSDLAGFKSLPGSMAAAVKSGAAQGVSGIKVYLDGAEVGRLVAPYVSETIARDVIV